MAIAQKIQKKLCETMGSAEEKKKPSQYLPCVLSAALKQHGLIALANFSVTTAVIQRLNNMTIKTLINLLKKYDQEALVIMSNDSEGNNFSPLFEIAKCFYHPESTYSGDITEDKKDEKAVVLFPVN